MYKITKHAKERMSKYNVDEHMVKEALNNPEHILVGNKGRKIYHKKLNGYLLRIIIEEVYLTALMLHL